MRKSSESWQRRKPASRSERTVGLARAISKLGYCSRSHAAALITAGRVRLNGAVQRHPETPTRVGSDRIEIDGRAVHAAKKSYWMLNKPRGVVTTASDEHGRATVYECLAQLPGWLAPVGRLDKASEGLLLLTNDSEWAARVTAPETHLAKTYHVHIDRVADEALLAALRRGVPADNELLQAKCVRVLRAGQRNSWLEIVLDEGKNRQIRRMLEALDVQVLRLVRVAIGGLQLGELAKGASRELTRDEKLRLDAQMHHTEKKNASSAPDEARNKP